MKSEWVKIKYLLLIICMPLFYNLIFIKIINYLVLIDKYSIIKYFIYWKKNKGEYIIKLIFFIFYFFKAI